LKKDPANAVTPEEMQKFQRVMNISCLEAQGIKAERHTIPGDIQALVKYGIVVVAVKSTQNLYFIGERCFQHIPGLLSREVESTGSTSRAIFKNPLKTEQVFAIIMHTVFSRVRTQKGRFAAAALNRVYNGEGQH
jgi:hypothetical protein